MCFVYPTSLSCVSHSSDIWTAVIKNIRNIRQKHKKMFGVFFWMEDLIQ